jgi:hypothetical protein
MRASFVKLCHCRDRQSTLKINFQSAGARVVPGFQSPTGANMCAGDLDLLAKKMNQQYARIELG